MGKSFSFQLDISATVSQLGALNTAMTEGSHTAVDDGAKVLQRFIQAAAPRKSGKLRASVTRFPSVRVGHGWEVRVGPTVDYAKIREFGGSIRAKNTPHRRLRYISDGAAHFPKVVHQHGTHYIEAGARTARDPIRDVMVARLDAVVKGVTG